MDANKLTQTRRETHGDWFEQSQLADHLLSDVMSSNGWNEAKPHQRIAVLMILTKISRIMTGNPSEPDHWDDIGGYALLGKQGHDK